MESIPDHCSKDQVPWFVLGQAWQPRQQHHSQSFLQVVQGDLEIQFHQVVLFYLVNLNGFEKSVRMFLCLGLKMKIKIILTNLHLPELL